MTIYNFYELIKEDRDLLKEQYEKRKSENKIFNPDNDNLIDYIIEQRLKGEIYVYNKVLNILEENGISSRRIELMKYLTPREEYVLTEKGKSYEDIAKELNITRERVRQIEKKATEKLNKLLEKNEVIEDEK